LKQNISLLGATIILILNGILRAIILHSVVILVNDEQAKNCIVETIRKAATHSYSIDPSLVEEKGFSFPDGAEEGCLWQTDPPPYEIVFSCHLDAQTDRWPHWLAVMACHAPTALLTASACLWYNDFRTDEDGSSPGDPEDPDDRPPNDDDGYIPDYPYDPGNPDHDDDYTPQKGTTELEVGYFYESGDGVEVKHTWRPQENAQGHLNKMPGWDFVVSIDDVPASGFVYYTIELNVKTENDSKTYLYRGEQRDMYYGVSAYNNVITVEWKSSFQGGDNLTKEATATAVTQSSFTASMRFDDVLITSETPPEFCGKYLTATLRGYFNKTGKHKVWDNFYQKWVMRRYRRRFARYRLSRRANLDDFVRDCVVANPPAREGTYSPDKIKGSSEGLDGPIVTAVSVQGSAAHSSVKKPIGVFSSYIVAEFESCKASFKVNGSSYWREDGKTEYNHGSISGTFVATLPTTTIDMIV
jgi:hypothetical protein